MTRPIEDKFDLRARERSHKRKNEVRTMGYDQKFINEDGNHKLREYLR